MWTLELVMFGLLGIMAYLGRNVIFSYQVVGNILDTLGVPGVQEQVLKVRSNLPLMLQTTDRYVFITQYVTLAAIITVIVMGLTYLQLKVAMTTGVSSTGLIVMSSLFFGGIITWLWSFDPTPAWLYETQLIVLLAKSKMDLEVLEEAIGHMDTKVQELKPDGEWTVSEMDAYLITTQHHMMKDLADEVRTTITDLEQQQQEHRATE